LATADDDPETYSVTFYVQQLERVEDDIVSGPSALIATAFSYTAIEGETLKDVIQRATSNGSLLDNDVWDNNQGIHNTSWLSSLDVNTGANGWETYQDWNNYTDNQNGTTTYEGESWTYFIGNNTPDTIYAGQ
jgi:hypothetical protein